MDREFWKRIALAVGVGLIAGAAPAAANEAYARTCLDTSASLFWKTPLSSTVKVGLDWPDGAAKAVVSLNGSDVATVSDTTKRTVEVALGGLPLHERSERIATLGIVYSDAGGATLGTASAKLALVVNDESVRVKDPAGSAWAKSVVPKPLLPILAGATSLTIQGTEVTPDIAARGWHKAAFQPGKSNALKLETEEETYEVTIGAPFGGSVIAW